MKKATVILLILFTVLLKGFGTSVYAGAPAPPPPLGVGGCQPDEIYTAIGCVPILNGGNDLVPFMAFVLGWGVGIAGGIAFLLILYAGFQVMTSSGNPQRVQAGKELLGAAISGVLLLVFSTFILRVVGVDILKIF